MDSNQQTTTENPQGIAFGNRAGQSDNEHRDEVQREHVRHKRKTRRKHHRQLTNEEEERRRQWKIIAKTMPCIFFVTGIVLIFCGQAHIDETQRNWELTLTGISMAVCGGAVFLVLLIRDWVKRAAAAIKDRHERNEFDDTHHSVHHHHHHHDDSDGSDDDEPGKAGEPEHHHHHRHHSEPSSFTVE